ncbi:entericidin A/B family lipoprotein [uncultured Tateyamaria sp.]|nr:entericidin A/B family lipoprotein [uncultured Tateyamaria sp.]
MKLHILALFSVLALAACETADGFGRDVQAGGEAISDVSNDVQQEL